MIEPRYDIQKLRAEIYNGYGNPKNLLVAHLDGEQQLVLPTIVESIEQFYTASIMDRPTDKRVIRFVRKIGNSDPVTNSGVRKIVRDFSLTAAVPIVYSFLDGDYYREFFVANGQRVIAAGLCEIHSHGQRMVIAGHDEAIDATQVLLNNPITGSLDELIEGIQEMEIAHIGSELRELIEAMRETEAERITIHWTPRIERKTISSPRELDLHTSVLYDVYNSWYF